MIFAAAVGVIQPCAGFDLALAFQQAAVVACAFDKVNRLDEKSG